MRFKKAGVQLGILVILVTVFSVLSWLYVQPLLRNSGDMDVYQARLETLAKRENASRQRLAQLEYASRDGGDLEVFFIETDGAETTATLQTVVRSMIIESGGMLETLQATENQTSALHKKTAIIVRGRINEKGFHQFLAKIATHNPMLGVDSLEIQQISVEQQTLNLIFSAVIYGYSRYAS